MPTIRVTPDLEMHYLLDDYTDPWRSPETVLMLHGVAENGGVWFGWVPHLARHFRTVRPDMRGYGRSTPMPRGYQWTMNTVVDDFIALMDALQVERFHLVGAKLGGMFARRLASRFPDRVLTLTLAGTPVPYRDIYSGKPERSQALEKEGVEPWARRTMQSRLGGRFPAAGAEWWIREMARTDSVSLAGFRMMQDMDVTADLPRITCPTLVISTEGSALGSADETRAWQQKIRNSRLLVLPGDSYHVAASDADRCAQETRDFILSAKY